MAKKIRGWEVYNYNQAMEQKRRLQSEEVPGPKEGNDDHSFIARRAFSAADGSVSTPTERREERGI